MKGRIGQYLIHTHILVQGQRPLTLLKYNAGTILGVKQNPSKIIETN